jgi:hypothetical protein
VYSECSRKLPIRVPELRPGKLPAIDVPFDEDLVKKLRKRRTLFNEAYLPSAMRGDARFIPERRAGTPELAPG